MKDLDLEMVKIAQENSAQYQRAQQEMIDKEKTKEIVEISDDEIEEIEKRFYDFSVQTDDHKKKKEIFGNLYVSKKDKENIKKRIMTFLKIAGAIVVLYGTFKGGEALEMIDTYNDSLNQKIENELTKEQIEIYQDEHKNAILNAIEAYQEIQEEKNNLDSDNYDFCENNITESDKDYLPFEKDGLINLTEKTQDAIDAATDNVIEEYQRRAR